MRKPKAQKEVPEVIIPIPEGLTKREYLAAMFLQGMLGSQDEHGFSEDSQYDHENVLHFSGLAIIYADALMTAFMENPNPKNIRERYITILRKKGLSETEIKRRLKNSTINY